ncbi:MAG: UDP-2,3-diacylglucosamine diphosphatase [Gemmatimonadaceae bacterium]|jgi:UDP-2,3-diacylglucosamine hydrolase
MLPAPCYVIADAHLGVAPAETERELLAFLRAFPSDGRALVINGDLFDFWFEWKEAVPRRGVRVLGELARLHDAGVEILWIAGNHDCWGGEVLRRDLGLAYHMGAWRGSIGGWDTLIEHGDGLRAVEDAPYRRLRRVLRHPLSIWAYRRLHPDWGTWLALRSSHTSRNMRPRDGGEGLRQVAASTLSHAGAPQLYVLAHSHVATLEPLGTGIFGNPGAWLDGPQALKITADRIERLTWQSGRFVVTQSLPHPGPTPGATAAPTGGGMTR